MKGFETGNIRLYCAQINPVVGDFKNNYEIIATHLERAKKNSVDIIAYPELCITGYPPEDLVLKPAFIEENLQYLDKIKKLTAGITAILGFVNKDFEIYNSAAIIHNKKIVSIYNKQFLPNYSVFDEERYFQKGTCSNVYKIKGNIVGINICEDIYYSSGPVKLQTLSGGAGLIINISASPYHSGKIQEREKLLFTRAVDNRVNILYVNMVGGQDELVFDGNSLLMNEKGEILARAKPFEEDYFIFDLNIDEVEFTRLQDTKYKNQRNKIRGENIIVPVITIEEINKTTGKNNKESGPENNSGMLNGNNRIINNTFTKIFDRYKELISCNEEEILKALVLGTKDYIQKNRFKKVVLGLSGGVDSSFTAVIASLAIGSKNVTGIIMPSIYSSKGSIEDSEALAEKTGIKTIIIPISKIYDSYLVNLNEIFKNSEINITKENLQARIRGNILMGLSNENGWLVLATGNKSEISVGYCTLYGDMVGGFSPIKDIYKTMVYRICNFINKKYSNIIPDQILKKVPSAELRPDQTDQDKLPPYELLDSILKAYIEEEKDYREIVQMGYKEKMVKEIINMVDFNEYKRRQGSPGIKITQRAFGKDRRYPITNRFKLR